jgi:hypothetical protein
VRGAVGAGGEVGAVALEPGQVRALASSSQLTLLTAPSRAMNRFRLTVASPGTAFAALAACSSIPRSVPPCPVGPVSLADHLVAALVLRPGGPGLGEHVPVGPAHGRPPGSMTAWTFPAGPGGEPVPQGRRAWHDRGSREVLGSEVILWLDLFYRTPRLFPGTSGLSASLPETPLTRR